VEAVQSSSQNTQFIMATHSPTVILDRVDLCREIRSKS
jgi:predicted ATPase